MLRTRRFEAQHEHALFKELQYSELWQARLQDEGNACADGNACAASPGQQLMPTGTPVPQREAGMCVSYAPQRFERG